MVLTFDDLPAQRAQSLPSRRIVEISEELVALLVSREIPGIGFVNENKLEVDGRLDPGRVELLEFWLTAGLELGSVIVRVDGRAVRLTDELLRVVRSKRPGQSVLLGIFEPATGRRRDVPLKLGELGSGPVPK